MRLIHFSDTHLGFLESSRVDPVSGINVREQDAYTAFNSVISAAITRKPDLVIHAGDLFHSPRPSNRAIVTALIGLQRLSEARIPVVLIAGNHSVPRVAATGSLFEAMRVLPGIRSAHGGRYEVFKVGQAAVHCIPHISTEEALRAAFDEVQIETSMRFNILVMHGAVRGTGEQYSLAEFNEVVIGKDALAHAVTFDYVALGHYHKHLQVGANAWYSGSTERFHLREAGYGKGFLEINLATHKVTFHPIQTREILTIPRIDCRRRSLPEIVAAVEDGLRQTQSTTDKIVSICLDEIDPATWIEFQGMRRAIEREHAADAFEVRWDRAFSKPRGKKGHTHTIGSLAMEFAAFMKTASVEGFSRDRLRRLGEQLISEAISAEPPE